LGRIGPERFGLIWICTADFLWREKHDVSVEKHRSEMPERWIKNESTRKKRSREIAEIIASSNFVMQREDFFSCQRPNGKPEGKMTRFHRTRNHRGCNQYMKQGCDYSEIEPQYGADEIRTRRIDREENGKVTDLGDHFIFHLRFSG